MNAPDAVSAQNIIINLAIFIGTLIGAFITYRKARRADELTSPDDVVLAGASIADMRPVRVIGADIKRLANASEGIERALGSIEKILLAQQESDKSDKEDELRDRIRDLERSLTDAGRSPPPRRR